MELFDVVNISQIKKQHQLESYSLVDFTVGYDDLIYLLFSQENPEENNVNFIKTRTITRYAAFTLLVDWESGDLLNINFIDLGLLDFHYHFLRPYNDSLMLIGARCRFHANHDIEQNVLLLDKNGSRIKEMCFGDGIEDCITTEDGKIIVSYFDEGVFGNYGWKSPIGSPGLIVWNNEGKIIWTNTRYNIYDCYAIHLDSTQNLWFYYYNEFNLVGTDFHNDLVINPNIRGCNAFALSSTRQEILFRGGYSDPFFYQYTIDVKQGKISEKQKVDIQYHDMKMEEAICNFCGPKLLFLIHDNLCGFEFV